MCVYVCGAGSEGGAGLTVGFNREIRAKFGIPNLTQSPDIGSKSDGDIFDFNMKHGPVTKIGNKSKTMSKNLTMTSCRQILISLLFFRFMANLKQPGSRIPEA